MGVITDKIKNYSINRILRLICKNKTKKQQTTKTTNQIKHKGRGLFLKRTFFKKWKKNYGVKVTGESTRASRDLRIAKKLAVFSGIFFLTLL